MGMWQDDSRHGNGVIVTLDGLYFEGNFVGGKITVGILINCLLHILLFTGIFQLSSAACRYHSLAKRLSLLRLAAR